MSSSKPRIAFCTTCKGRLDHVRKTLPANISDNRDYANAVFVLLDYADSPHLREYLKDHHKADIESGRLVVYHYFGENKYREGPPAIRFHMTHAKNMAMRCGILEGADLLVTLDADNFTGKGFASWIAVNITKGTIAHPDFDHIRLLPFGAGRPTRGYYGRFVVSSSDFLKMGGYDENFATWHGEDTDILARMKRARYARQFIPIRFLSNIPHDAGVRFKEYPEAQKNENVYLCRSIEKELNERTNTVVNEGQFGIGPLFRNFAASYIQLKPIPTRILGIGMHRTATTSLHCAFEALGFDSFHFRTGNEARLIWEEMNNEGRSKTLEQWYALSDLPIPLLYKKLDVAYPGSKFILTVRDEQKWLESVRRLWSYDANPMRWTWDQYPISHRLHKALYGREDFDVDTFVNRYRKHNEEVKQYFKDRPEDLLVMDIEAGAGWSELCKFLGLNTPSEIFPYKTHTISRRATNAD